MAQLQVALDGTLAEALRILSSIHDTIDIVEIGTPLIYREGMHGLARVRDTYPDLSLLADLKIMDAGGEEASIAFEAGADFVTVMGVTHHVTIEAAVKSARNHGGEVMVDMMRVGEPAARAATLAALGCDVLCVHTAYDVRSSEESPYRALSELRRELPDARLAIAGGVNEARLDHILPHSPDIIIVGGAVTGADDPAKAAKRIKERLEAHDTR